MFSFLKKGEPVFVSPVEGNLIPLDQVKDAVFAQKLMGDGIAFLPSQDTIYAPCDAQVVMIANTMHAIGCKHKAGIEFLLHIGLDTVNLQGKGFTCLVQNGDKIKQGQPLMRLDLAYFNSLQIDLTTPLIITNPNGYTMNITTTADQVHAGDEVLTMKES